MHAQMLSCDVKKHDRSICYEDDSLHLTDYQRAKRVVWGISSNNQTLLIRGIVFACAQIQKRVETRIFLII